MWLEGDTFGSVEVEPEEELELLKQILFTKLPSKITIQRYITVPDNITYIITLYNFTQYHYRRDYNNCLKFFIVLRSKCYVLNLSLLQHVLFLHLFAVVAELYVAFTCYWNNSKYEFSS